MNQTIIESKIRAAYDQVRSGADYPRLVQQLKALGIRSYEHELATGKNAFHLSGEDTVTLGGMGPAVPVAPRPDSSALGRAIAEHQHGKTDYPTVCTQAGQAGVHRWVADLQAMTVSYLDAGGGTMLVEPIPTAHDSR